MPELPEIVWQLQIDTQRTQIIAAVEDLLRILPPRDIAAIDRIVLKHAAEDNREDRRKFTQARGKKVQLNQARGFYRQAWQGEQAYIVLHLDRIFQGALQPQSTWSSQVRIGMVLYHEIGHHVAKTRQTEHREPENDADRYGALMLQRLMIKRWYLFAGALLAGLLKPKTWKILSYVFSVYRSGKKARSKQ